MRTLTTRQRKLLRDTDRKLRAASEAGADSPDGDLNIVPFLDVVVNLVMFLLMTVTATLAMAEVPVTTPTTPTTPPDAHTNRAPQTPRAPAAAPYVPPVVHLGADGVHVFAAGQRLAPGCQAHGTDAVTIPRVGGEQDWLALRACAQELGAQAHGQHDGRVDLSGVASTPYEDVVHAMDAVRGSAAQPLFDDVRWLAAAR